MKYVCTCHWKPMDSHNSTWAWKEFHGILPLLETYHRDDDLITNMKDFEERYFPEKCRMQRDMEALDWPFRNEKEKDAFHQKYFPSMKDEEEYFMKFPGIKKSGSKIWIGG